MKITKLLILALILFFLENQKIISQNNDFDSVYFNTEDGGKIEAALFKSNSTKIIIYAHGAIFNKESWFFLAKKFQEQNIAGLSIDFRGYGNSKSGTTSNRSYDILGALNYAKNNGYTSIYLIGGSMGGEAILSALDQMSDNIAKVVLLAPAGGPAIKSKQINKLFIVSKDEERIDRVVKIYKGSADPKKIREYSGNSHAQHLFNSKHAKNVENLIISFMVED